LATQNPLTSVQLLGIHRQHLVSCCKLATDCCIAIMVFLL
jgi:hypothetical protein